MAGGRLRNVVRKGKMYQGKQIAELIGPDGQPVHAYNRYARSIISAAYTTRKRYLEVNSHLVDYLYEYGVLGQVTSRAAINLAIDDYLLLLRDGAKVFLGQVEKDGRFTYSDGDREHEARLRRIARTLNIRPISAASWNNTIAAINGFLRMCDRIAEEDHEKAVLRGGIDAQTVALSMIDYRPLFDALDGAVTLSPAERHAMKMNSLLGGVIKSRGAVRRPAGIRAPDLPRGATGLPILNFPEERFQDLTDAATYWRDKAMWDVEMGAGVRRSEATNMRWCDIDFERREVYILEPADGCYRFGEDMPQAERNRRFKGRTVSWTYFRQPYRDQFFEALEHYRRLEYRIPEDGNDFVFQCLMPPWHGKPLKDAHDDTLNDSFVNACKRAGIPGPRLIFGWPGLKDHWTSHSLRHAYGWFMRNEYQVTGRAEPGLTLSELQILMGHTNIKSTERYGRRSEQRLRGQLEASDARRLQDSVALPDNPEQAKRQRQQVRQDLRMTLIRRAA